MKPYLYNVVNAIVLISLGSWSYFTSEHPSVTALIPVFAGIILIGISPGLKKGKGLPAHIAAGLTFILLIAFIKPLSGAIKRSDGIGIARVTIMMITSFVTMIIFVKSFIEARKLREKKV
jgi:hypothetical protein